MEPLISVIVPIYGIDKYLGLCIESIINQTYQQLEIILVDDGSPDRCPEICDLYAKKDPRIKVIHKENGGLVSARKAGVQAAAGDFIGYVDGDDWIGSGFYQSLISLQLESNADVVIAGFQKDLFSKSKPILNSIPTGIYEEQQLEWLWSNMLSYKTFYHYGVMTYLWNKLFKRELIERWQMPVDERITVGEDAAVVYPLLLNCKKVCISDNCAYHYRQREDSMLKQAGNIQDEAKRLKVLYDYLSQAMAQYPKKFHLQDQIDDYITGTYIIRTGGVTPFQSPELKTFPLSKNISGKRIILYGAGTFGQHLMRRILESKICEIAAWVDDDYWEYRRCCLDVDSVLSISSFQYDYILIASLSSSYAEKVKKKLLDLGVPESKMLTIQTTQDNRSLALKEYLAIPEWWE